MFFICFLYFFDFFTGQSCNLANLISVVATLLHTGSHLHKIFVYGSLLHHHSVLLPLVPVGLGEIAGRQAVPRVSFPHSGRGWCRWRRGYAPGVPHTEELQADRLRVVKYNEDVDVAQRRLLTTCERAEEPCLHDGLGLEVVGNGPFDHLGTHKSYYWNLGTKVTLFLRNKVQLNGEKKQIFTRNSFGVPYGQQQRMPLRGATK